MNYLHFLFFTRAEHFESVHSKFSLLREIFPFLISVTKFQQCQLLQPQAIAVHISYAYSRNKKGNEFTGRVDLENAMKAKSLSNLVGHKQCRSQIYKYWDLRNLVELF